MGYKNTGGIVSSFNNLSHGRFGQGEVDLGAVDLAVQEKGVGAEKTGGQSKDDGKDGGSRTAGKAQHSSGNLVAGRCQSGENVVDEFASASVRVKVLSDLQVGLALDGSLVRLLADFGNFSVVVVVVVAVVIVVVVFVDLEARNAFVLHILMVHI